MGAFLALRDKVFEVQGEGEGQSKPGGVKVKKWMCGAGRGRRSAARSLCKAAAVARRGARLRPDRVSSWREPFRLSLVLVDFIRLAE